MKENEKAIVSGLVALLVILWLGFILHRSPRFAGSAWGGAFGVSGALLMLVPLLYSVVKRIKPLKKIVTKAAPMRTLLAWHIYAGVLGPILVIIHSGHKFESPLGLALTAMTLVVVVSGFVGRYLMGPLGKGVRMHKARLDDLNAAFAQVLDELSATDDGAAQVRMYSGTLSSAALGLVPPEDRHALPPGARVVELTEAIAHLEDTIERYEWTKAAFATWLKVHIWISGILYFLLGLHVWAAIYFGLRWFR